MKGARAGGQALPADLNGRGLHCAPGAHRFLGTFPEGTVRVSPGPFTTSDDIDALVAALREISA